ncbi:hypothetical protein LRR81_13995 [Metabacillus sp. GX 13764]|uniref:hypothetical protein n=1 Tax=Metabacillus kandeliae TaxID=2900151 RepID=UPI001E4A2FF5|nr:hypothetical protein [Metabacillus kandeliae]MCD7035352.1 hypothetical protein [Metabacillus kandeliae]
MKNSKWFYLLMLFIPWLSVPLLGSRALKRYLPAAIFICTFTKAVDLFGEKKKWWKFYKGSSSFQRMNLFNLGPYFVSSLWMMRFAYGRFPLYIFANMILHIWFIYFGGLKLLDQYRIGSLRKLTKFQYFVIDFIRALLLYGFQYAAELSGKQKK